MGRLVRLGGRGGACGFVRRLLFRLPFNRNQFHEFSVVERANNVVCGVTDGVTIGAGNRVMAQNHYVTFRDEDLAGLGRTTAEKQS